MNCQQALTGYHHKPTCIALKEILLSLPPVEMRTYSRDQQEGWLSPV